MLTFCAFMASQYNIFFSLFQFLSVPFLFHTFLLSSTISFIHFFLSSFYLFIHLVFLLFFLFLPLSLLLSCTFHFLPLSLLPYPLSPSLRFPFIFVHTDSFCVAFSQRTVFACTFSFSRTFDFCHHVRAHACLASLCIAHFTPRRLIVLKTNSSRFHKTH